MTQKSDSKWLSLATAPILGQPPSRVPFCIVLTLLRGNAAPVLQVWHAFYVRYPQGQVPR